MGKQPAKGKKDSATSGEEQMAASTGEKSNNKKLASSPRSKLKTGQEKGMTKLLFNFLVQYLINGLVVQCT
jgi:hypothetical protein